MGYCVIDPDSPQLAYNPEDADATVRTPVLGAPPVDDVHTYDPKSDSQL